MRTVRCPGRVNLIGDHTDYNGGIAMPMAIDLYTEAVFRPDGSKTTITITSEAEPDPATFPADLDPDPDRIRAMEPAWARTAAAIVALLRTSSGGSLAITGNLPLGAGLSSSAAFEVATALALGLEGDPVTIATFCRHAGELATGVPAGLMDQLTVTSATAGHALLIDFSDLTTQPVPIPENVEVVVVHSGESRSLAKSAYAARRAECEAASFHVGELGQVAPSDVQGLPDPLLRRRARHVTTECERVRAFAEALAGGRPEEAGKLMLESHRSLAEDFEVSTPGLDSLVERLSGLPRVYGARLTGAGFGGCVVALCEPGTVDVARYPSGAWVVSPSAAATVTGTD